MEPQPQPETESQGVEVIVDSAENATDSLRYEDGSVEKKVYGEGSSDACREFFVHLIERTKQEVETIMVNAELNLQVGQLLTLIEEKIKIALNEAVLNSKLEEEGYKKEQTLSSFVSQEGSERVDLYVSYDETKAIIKSKEAEIRYEPIIKYSFLDDKSKVKVYLELPGIGQVPPENITSRFLEWSIEVKIQNYNGKNWIFAVPKTQCIVKPKESKVLQKENKLIIVIGKNTDSDNWFSLYKTRMVGERDD